MKNVIKNMIFMGCGLMFLVGCDKQSTVDEAMSRENEIQKSAVKVNEIKNEIDIDMTQMSSEIVLALLDEFVVSPQEYSGQSIRMQGAYYLNFNE